MDIITSFLPKTDLVTNQADDFVNNFSLSPGEDLDKESEQLDPSQVNLEYNAGQNLPLDGNKQPITIAFSDLLTQQVQLNDNGAWQAPTEFTQTQTTPATFLQLGDTRDPQVPNEVISSRQESTEINISETTATHKLSQDLSQMTSFTAALKQITPDTVNNQISTEESQILNDIKLLASKELAIRPTFIQHAIKNNSDVEDEPFITQETEEVVTLQSIEEDPNDLNINPKQAQITQVKETTPPTSYMQYTLNENTENQEQDIADNTQYQIASNLTVNRKQDTMGNVNTSETTIHRENFEQDLSQKIKIMISGNETTAQFDVFPQDLGKIEVKITFDDNKAHINFITSQLETQELIESSIERLKSEVNAMGLNLGNVSVSQGKEEKQHTGKHALFSHDNEMNNNVEATLAPVKQSPAGKLDIYV